MRSAAHRLIDKHRAVVMLLDSHEFDTPLCSKSGEQRRLASRPRTHVEPCLLRVIDQRTRWFDVRPIISDQVTATGAVVFDVNNWPSIVPDETMRLRILM